MSNAEETKTIQVCVDALEGIHAHIEKDRHPYRTQMQGLCEAMQQMLEHCRHNPDAWHPVATALSRITLALESRTIDEKQREIEIRAREEAWRELSVRDDPSA